LLTLINKSSIIDPRLFWCFEKWGVLVFSSLKIPFGSYYFDLA